MSDESAMWCSGIVDSSSWHVVKEFAERSKNLVLTAFERDLRDVHAENMLVGAGYGGLGRDYCRLAWFLSFPEGGKDLIATYSLRKSGSVIVAEKGRLWPRHVYTGDVDGAWRVIEKRMRKLARSKESEASFVDMAATPVLRPVGLQSWLGFVKRIRVAAERVTVRGVPDDLSAHDAAVLGALFRAIQDEKAVGVLGTEVRRRIAEDEEFGVLYRDAGGLSIDPGRDDSWVRLDRALKALGQ